MRLLLPWNLGLTGCNNSVSKICANKAAKIFYCGIYFIAGYTQAYVLKSNFPCYHVVAPPDFVYCVRGDREPSAQTAPSHVAAGSVT